MSDTAPAVSDTGLNRSGHRSTVKGVTEDHAALLLRAQEAIDAAVRVLDDSEVMVASSALLRDAGLPTRCAWCGRYHVADRWVVVEDMPDFVAFKSATHGICDDCLAALRAAGMSV